MCARGAPLAASVLPPRARDAPRRRLPPRVLQRRRLELLLRLAHGCRARRCCRLLLGELNRERAADTFQ